MKGHRLETADLKLIDPDKILRTERLILEPVCERHAAHLFPGLAEPALYEFLDAEPPVSIAELADRYRRLESRRCRRGGLLLAWAVRHPELDYLGRIEAQVLSTQFANIGYIFFVNSWGKGFAHEACRGMLQFLRDSYSLERIGAGVETSNVRSIRLLERLGLTKVSTKVNAGVKDGRPYDDYQFEGSLPEIICSAQ